MRFEIALWLALLSGCTTECIRHSDCPAQFICGVDSVCVPAPQDLGTDLSTDLGDLGDLGDAGAVDLAKPVDFSTSDGGAIGDGATTD